MHKTIRKVFEWAVLIGIAIGGALTLFFGWVLLVFVSMLPFIFKVGIVAGVVYIFLKLFGML